MGARFWTRGPLSSGRGGGFASARQSRSRTIPTLRAHRERENASRAPTDASVGTLLRAVAVPRVVAFGSVPLDGDDGKRLFVRFPATNPRVLYLIIYPVRVAV